MRALTRLDHLLSAASAALVALSNTPTTLRAYPQRENTNGQGFSSDQNLSSDERRESAALMRVNHVGEIYAQALYSAQALTARDPPVRRHHQSAAADEAEHLAWTRTRIAELGGRTSWLNPLWYAGAFGIGLLAGRAGDQASLGFVIETERQVEQHLAGHLQRLPAQDHQSRAIVQQMLDDEVRHARAAQAAGGVVPAWPVRWAMRAAAKLMTTTAYYV